MAPVPERARGGRRRVLCAVKYMAALREVNKTVHRCRSPIILALLFVGYVGVNPSAGQDRPLPTAATLRERVLARARHQEALRENYTFRETRIREVLRAGGPVKSRRVKIFQIFPNPYGPPSANLLAKDGKQTTAEQRRKQIERDLRQREQHRHASAEARSGEEAKSPPLSRVLELYGMTVIGREQLNGRPTIKVALTPNPEATPRSFVEKAMLKMAGTAWIDEASFYIMRVSMRSIGTVRRWLITSSREFSFELWQEQIDRQVVFPERSQLAIQAKMLGLFSYRLRIIREFSHYQRFTSGMEILLPREPSTSSPLGSAARCPGRWDLE